MMSIKIAFPKLTTEQPLTLTQEPKQRTPHKMQKTKRLTVNHKNHGFSLLEMLLVLILIATLSWSFIAYRSHQQEKITAIHIQNNLNTLWAASKLYYHNHCTTDSPFNMSIEDVKDHLSSWTPTPAVVNYAISANYLGLNINQQPLYQLTIILTFNSHAAKRLPWFQQQFGGEILNATSIRLEKLPGQITLGNQMGLADAEQQFFCNSQNFHRHCAE